MERAGAALLYAAARETIAPYRSQQRAGQEPLTDEERLRRAEERTRLIDWDLATKVAVRAAGRTPSLHPGARAQLQDQYEAMLRDIEAPIAAYVGNQLSLQNTAVEVMDRPGWIRANMINFRFLLQPVEDFYRENVERTRVGPPLAFQQAARMMLSSQVGVLVGYMSRRVLGQYDIALLGEEPITAGKL